MKLTQSQYYFDYGFVSPFWQALSLDSIPAFDAHTVAEVLYQSFVE
jgi:hypothetical protein